MASKTFHLSASAAKRWLNCTGSAKLEAGMPAQLNKYNEAGTLAHSLLEISLKHICQQMKLEDYQKQLEEIRSSEHFDNEMSDVVDETVAIVLEHFAELKEDAGNAEIIIETKLPLQPYIKRSKGILDILIIGDGHMKVIDFKFGRGVAVYAERNEQLMLYALAAAKQFGFMYELDQVELVILQPRINNFSRYATSFKDLELWAKDELMPKAAIAQSGKGATLAAGSWCKYCKARNRCKVLAEMAAEPLQTDFKPELLTDAEVLELYAKADLMASYAKSVKEYVVDQAFTKRKDWQGFKLVAGRSVTRWNKEETEDVIEALRLQGFEDADIFNFKLKSIGDIKKRLSVDDFEKHVKPYTVKPKGKATLVPDTDKRQPYFDDGVDAFFQ